MSDLKWMFSRPLDDLIAPPEDDAANDDDPTPIIREFPIVVPRAEAEPPCAPGDAFEDGDDTLILTPAERGERDELGNLGDNIDETGEL